MNKERDLLRRAYCVLDKWAIDESGLQEKIENYLAAEEEKQEKEYWLVTYETFPGVDMKIGVLSSLFTNKKRAEAYMSEGVANRNAQIHSIKRSEQ